MLRNQNSSLLQNIKWIVLAFFLLLNLGFFLPDLAHAEDGKSGLAPNRLQVPSGPGSLEGVGPNAEVNPNMGVVSYSVPISLPAGYQGFSPSLGVTYSSSSGASEVGIGWSLSTMFITRMTSKSLPRYSRQDTFATSSGTELVEVSRNENEVHYRARFESGFVKYRFMDEDGTGQHGYWIAEYPDGSLAYFGANAQGQVVENARMEGAEGTFHYFLVDHVDTYQNRIDHQYVKHEGHPYLSEVLWAHNTQGIPRYRAMLTYEERPDVLSDAKSGREILLSKRLADITVLVREAQLRRYHFAYEPREEVGALSRLSSVTTFGLNDEGPFPISFQFKYTGTFDPACQRDPNCELPRLLSLGQTEASLLDGTADFIDINGDALPDLLNTAEGPHQISLMQSGALSPSLAAPNQSITAEQIPLNNENVHLVDINGDGYSDLIDGTNQRVLWNNGNGDWALRTEVADMNLPNLAPADPNARFLDVNGDHQIDVVHIEEADAWWNENLGNGQFADDPERFENAPGVGFEANRLQLADINGDGLLDLAMPPLDGTLSYFLNLGWGRFSEQRDMQNVPVEFEGNLDHFEITDINGDSLADLLVVLDGAIQYALNQSGRFFDATVMVRAVSTPAAPEQNQGLPSVDEQTAIRFADVNGSGSRDIVYFLPGGEIAAVELFPRKANLLSKVENGIGKVIELTYGTTTNHMGRDSINHGNIWRHKLPHAMLTLDSVTLYDTLSRIRQIQAYRYHHGYYDGEERQFRGFEEVELFVHGDDSVENGTTHHVYEVGERDPYRKGLLLAQTTYSSDRALSTVRTTFEDCELSGIPDDVAVPIRFICPTSSETVLKEGRPEQEWVTLESRSHYDAWGNVVLAENLGVTQIGGGECVPCAEGRDPLEIQGEACGPQCLGDEQFEETEFIAPEDIVALEGEATPRWLPHLPHTVRALGSPGSELFTEAHVYYDGDDFEGLPLGQASRGLVKRKAAKKAEGVFINTERFAHDARGNVFEARDANGHKRVFGYDEDRLLVVSEEILLDDPALRETPYALRMRMHYHPILEKPVEGTSWMRVENGAELSAPRSSQFAYDAYGRITKIALPGDSLDTPTQVFAYALQNPVSNVITQARTQSGGPLDLQSMQCFDGLGRKTQSKTKLEQNRYQADGFVLFNIQGENRRIFQPFVSDSGACDQTAPEDVYFTDAFFDAAGRPLRTIEPDAEMYGEASVSRVAYGPLWVQAWDPEDNDPESPFFGTPTQTFTDGLERTVRTERLLGQGEEPAAVTFTFDPLGRARSHIDPEGNEKVQFYDLLGRVIRVEDPDGGTSTAQYDDVGNAVRTVDGRGVATVLHYDEANRSIAQFEEGNREATELHWVYDALHEDRCDAEICSNVEGKVSEVSYPLLHGRRGVERFGYDERGQAVYAGVHRNGNLFPFRTEYDNAGRVVLNTYPDGMFVTQVYDQGGRLVEIPGFVDEVRYTERGVTGEVALSNGTRNKMVFDARLRLSNTSVYHPQNQTLLDYGYRRNRVGHITEIEDNSTETPQSVSLPSANAAYTYDAWYRLTQASLEQGRAKEEVLSYRYSLSDNILKKTSSLEVSSPAHVGQMQYAQGEAGPHAMTQAGPYTYRYDAAGQMTHQGERSLDHTWDHRARITETRKAGETLAEYAYDAGGERTVKLEKGHRTDVLSPAFEIRDGVATLHVWMGGNRVAQVETLGLAAALLPDLAPLQPIENNANENDANMVQAEPDSQISIADAWALHAHAEGWLQIQGAPDELSEEDQTAQLLGAAAHRLFGAANLLADEEENPGTQTTFFHQNHLGSTSLRTDKDGNELEKTFYYPYGQIRGSENSLPNYSFTGKERDLSTGLSYHSARYLHPYSGCWLSPDPLADHPNQIGRSTYAYGWRNPINLSDDSGECPFCLALIIRYGTGVLFDYGAQTIINPMIGKEWNDFDHEGAFISGGFAIVGVYGSGAVRKIFRTPTGRRVSTQLFGYLTDVTESGINQFRKNGSMTFENTVSDLVIGQVIKKSSTHVKNNSTSSKKLSKMKQETENIKLKFISQPTDKNFNQLGIQVRKQSNQEITNSVQNTIIDVSTKIIDKTVSTPDRKKSYPLINFETNRHVIQTDAYQHLHNQRRIKNEILQKKD